MQQWLWSDYQLYDYFNYKLGQELRGLGEKKVDGDLIKLRKLNEELIEKCNAHFVDNESLKGTPTHMAHKMVKAYEISQNCTYYAIAEPAFYGQIKARQKRGRPSQNSI